jgi:argininosuccinate lyase
VPKKKSDKLWGARFEHDADSLTDQYNASISFDIRLYREDIAGSKAHATMLARQNIITTQDRDLILNGLAEIEQEIAEGRFIFSVEREDIHLNIEAALTERIGDAGRRLHTARSRNDQIATDIRLFVRDACDSVITSLRSFRSILLKLAEKESATVMPGYTHLQRAQPILLSHHLQAYEAMFARDTERFVQTRTRTNQSPLGTGALAGVSFKIDRALSANLLGFDGVIENSIDAVSDRDFVFDFHSACALSMIHISRLSEELILWASAEFGFLNLDDRFSTGSSIMPQKKNPDLAELARGKSARTIGNLVQIMTLLKGQPLAYNKDMQEDKEALFDSVDTVLDTINIMSAMLPSCSFNRQHMKTAAEANFSLATDYADYLTKKNVPFREAHSAVGSLVSFCEKENKTLAELTLEELQNIHPAFDKGALEITIESALNARAVNGGTAPQTVKKARKAAQSRLNEETK